MINFDCDITHAITVAGKPPTLQQRSITTTTAGRLLRSVRAKLLSEDLLHCGLECSPTRLVTKLTQL